MVNKKLLEVQTLYLIYYDASLSFLEDPQQDEASDDVGWNDVQVAEVLGEQAGDVGQRVAVTVV